MLDRVPGLCALPSEVEPVELAHIDGPGLLVPTMIVKSVAAVDRQNVHTDRRAPNQVAAAAHNDASHCRFTVLVRARNRR